MTLLENGTYVVERDVRTEPYEPPTRTPVASVTGLLSGHETVRIEDGGKAGRTVHKAVLSIDPTVGIDEECSVVDPDGNRWAIEAIAMPRGFGLDRNRLRLRRVEGHAR